MFKRSLIIAAGTASLLFGYGYAGATESDKMDSPQSEERQAFVDGPVGQTSGTAASGAVGNRAEMHRYGEPGIDRVPAIRDKYLSSGGVRVPWTVNESGFIQE